MNCQAVGIVPAAFLFASAVRLLAGCIDARFSHMGATETPWRGGTARFNLTGS